MHVLSVFTNTPPGASEEGFNRWYDEEHLPERVAVPGVSWAARYEFASGDYRYGALYALRDEMVLFDPAYRRLADPANWSTATREYFPALAEVMRRDVFSVVAGDPVPEAELAFRIDIQPQKPEEMKRWSAGGTGRAWLVDATANLLLSASWDVPTPEFEGGESTLGRRISYMTGHRIA